MERPKIDADNQGSVIWFGKRIDLGHDSQVWRLFWLHAKKLYDTQPGLKGRKLPLADCIVTLAEDCESEIGINSPSEKQRQACLRKTTQRLRQALASTGLANVAIESKLMPDARFGQTMIVSEPPQSAAA